MNKITINSLIKSLTIHNTNLADTKEKIKAAVTEALLNAVNATPEAALKKVSLNDTICTTKTLHEFTISGNTKDELIDNFIAQVKLMPAFVEISGSFKAVLTQRLCAVVK